MRTCVLSDIEAEKITIFHKRFLLRIKKIGHLNYLTIDNKTILLADIKVEEPYKRKGYGRELFNTLITIAKSKKINVIYGNIIPDTPENRSFYDSLSCELGLDLIKVEMDPFQGGPQFVYKVKK